MSELRSAIEGMRLETLAEVPDARLEEDFAELQRASELIDAERLRRLAENRPAGLLPTGRPPVRGIVAGLHVQGGLGHGPG